MAAVSGIVAALAILGIDRISRSPIVYIKGLLLERESSVP
jgi:hypothetical protein